MKISKLSPNFEVRDIRKSVEFYTQYFGFKLIMAVSESQDGVDNVIHSDKEYVYAMLQQDAVEIMFQRSDTFKTDVAFSEGLPIGATVSFTWKSKAYKIYIKALKMKNLKLQNSKKPGTECRSFM